MIIRINTEARTITVPTAFKQEIEAYNKILKRKGKKEIGVLEDIDIENFTVIAENPERIKDHTNKATIDKFMEERKTTDKDLYKEYVELKNKVVGKSSKGKEMKTSFLTIKKWFYEKYPEQKPTK